MAKAKRAVRKAPRAKARSAGRKRPQATNVAKQGNDLAQSRRELAQARAQQAAIADTLKVIASSPSDLQPVFDVIARKANQLIGGHVSSVLRFNGDMVELGGFTSLNELADSSLRASFPRPIVGDPLWEFVRGGEAAQIVDTETDTRLLGNRTRVARAAGYRSMLLTPLVSDKGPIGAIAVTRKKPGVFAPDHVELLRTFADQAVIAIQNAELFDEVQSRTRELTERNDAYSEQIDHQSATIEILKAMSASPGDAQPVFDVIVQRALRICNADIAVVLEFDGALVDLRSIAIDESSTSPSVVQAYRGIFPQPPSRDSVALRAILHGKIIHIPNMADDLELSQASRDIGPKGALALPLMRDGKVVGSIGLSAKVPGGFSRAQIELLKTFAEQAVIAIRSAEAFRQLHMRTNELSESLQQQTATADVLKVISRSAFDLDAVMHTLARSAAELCAAGLCGLYIREDNFLVCRGYTAISKAQEEFVREARIPVDDSGYVLSRVLSSGEIANIGDFDSDRSVATRSFQQKLGFKALLIVPLMREGRGIGVFVIGRERVGDFSQRHIELVQTFADQAVIAIENTRLFTETREALERQTATSDILRVIAGSPSDAQPVFEAILARALHLCEAAFGFLTIHNGERFDFAAQLGVPPALAENFRAGMEQPQPGDAHWRLIEGENLIHNLDQKDEDAYRAGNPLRRAVVDLGDARSALVVALRKDGLLRGSITIYRKEVRPFTESQIALLRHFADQAVIAIENTRLFNEVQAKTRDLTEALERQTASAEILKVIASSPSDVQPVLEAIVGSAARLFEPCAATILTLSDEKMHWRATAALHPDFDVERARAVYPMPFEPNKLLSARAIAERRIIELGDSEAHDAPDHAQRTGQISGFRSATFVPLVNNDLGVGTIILTHPSPGFKLSEKQLALVQTFADQAVIAIENARLFNETQEALERQTASADILKVIARSPSDVQPVFDAVVLTARRLLRREIAAILLCGDDATFRPRAITGPDGLIPILNPAPIKIDPEANFPSRAIVSKENQHLPDWSAIDLPEEERDIRKMYGLNSALYLPMVRGEQCIGVLLLGGTQPGAFNDADIALAESFRDQAVIAIENTRLFNETKEALERQTATADILKVIARSPSDVQPVFHQILDSAKHLIGGDERVIILADDDGMMRVGAAQSPREEDLYRMFPRPLKGSATELAIRERRLIAFADIVSDPLAPVSLKAIAPRTGARSYMTAPLLSDNRAIGAVTITRTTVDPFNEKECALLSTFADQAVIAIQNTRLFNETQQALERQTATADILQVIANSPDDVQPVFQAIAECSNRLVKGFATTVVSIVDDVVHLSAFTSTTPEADAAMRAFYPRPLSEFSYSDDIRRGEIHRIVDTEVDLAGESGLTMVRQRGWRSALWVPLLLDGESIGAIGSTRVEPGPFPDHHVNMLKTFADQAVIAIQNVRLFKQTQEALERQTATADILKVIASSPDDVQPVFQAIAERSNRLVSGLSTTVLSIDGDTIHLSAFTRTSPAADAALVESFPRKLSEMAFGESVSRGEIYRLPDTEAEPSLRELARLRGYRSMLFVPLLRDGVPIGMIGQTRAEPGPFADHHVEMLKTFADQAVIAISNVKLFKQVQERTHELSKSLDELRAAQDRLVQTEKLASLGQLTAGIAHEIKNPLNFVNNFSALSAELIDEMGDVLRDPELDENDKRRELDEISELLKSNLGKVVQHGKRADSIVKNMLLHSRSGAGEQRSADVNALVDESLNLAYHGARAEKQGFNITLERDFDPAVGAADIYPQEITRVFLNLISNGFYAATKRAAESGNGFEPVLKAATKNLGDTIEIRIRDNGAGIPSDVKDKIFNPFFTTKPAGEGTGLGLSMSHDIVVKQHGGTIDVATEPGAFTEFIITLPRRAAAPTAGGPAN